MKTLAEELHHARPRREAIPDWMVKTGERLIAEGKLTTKELDQARQGGVTITNDPVVRAAQHFGKALNMASLRSAYVRGDIELDEFEQQVARLLARP